MSRQIRTFVLAALAVLVLLTPTVFAQKLVKPLKQWSGAVEDENLLKDAPDCVTSTKGLEKLWKAWKIAEKMPEVDFAKELVVLVTSRGSRLLLQATVEEKDNLKVGGLGSRDLRPGFRYVIATVPRAGVKTVNGKELPKE